MSSYKTNIHIHLEPQGIRFPLPRGRTVYSVLSAHVPSFLGPCQGRGLCGACGVKMHPAPASTPEDERLLDAASLRHGWRLACRHRPEADVTITLGAQAIKERRGAPAAAISPGKHLMSLGQGAHGRANILLGRRRQLTLDEGKPAIGAVLDIGTTTVSILLVDLAGGGILSASAALNPQVAYGEDILSRLQLALQPQGLPALRDSLIAAVNGMLELACREAGVTSGDVVGLMVAANPAMATIFAGADPAPLLKPPFHPPRLPSVLPLRRKPRLSISQRAPIFMLPTADGYVGGDVMAGLNLAFATVPNSKAAFLYLDLGTNGEIVLNTGRRLLAASTAVGPAWEGRKISCGMRAESGAIDSCRLSADVAYTTIGGSPPMGICGSGLIDLLAGLIEKGLVDPEGALLSEAEASDYPLPRLAARLFSFQGERALRVFAGEKEIYLTQNDIRELQLAKAAVAAGIDILSREAGLAAEDIETVFVAGTFGYHVRRESLIGIGLFPPQWRERIIFLGNAALAGGARCLLSAAEFHRAEQTAARIKVVSLAGHPDFHEIFIAATRFQP